MAAKERVEGHESSTESLSMGVVGGRPPLLMVDIDGVISLFGVPSAERADARAIRGALHSIDGAPHFLSSTAAAHLLALDALYELVWASGWEERADEHLPHLLGLPAGLPFLRFARDVGGKAAPKAHWKLDAIDAFAGRRPLAWIDDAFNDACHHWAQARPAPTLLVQTAPEDGLTSAEAQLLSSWAAARSADPCVGARTGPRAP
jgi:Swiss Army Knife RNA repair-like protein